MCFVQDGQVDVEVVIGCFGFGNGLEYQIYWCVVFDGGNCVGDVGEYVGLCWDFVMCDYIGYYVDQFDYLWYVVGGGIDVDDCIVVVIYQVIEYVGGDVVGVICGVIGLQVGR